MCWKVGCLTLKRPNDEIVKEDWMPDLKRRGGEMVEEGKLSDHKPREYGAVVKEDWLPDLNRRGGEVVEEGGACDHN